MGVQSKTLGVFPQRGDGLDVIDVNFVLLVTSGGHSSLGRNFGSDRLVDELNNLVWARTFIVDNFDIVVFAVLFVRFLLGLAQPNNERFHIFEYVSSQLLAGTLLFVGPFQDNSLVKQILVVKKLEDGSNSRQKFRFELFDGQFDTTNQILLRLFVVVSELGERKSIKMIDID